MTFWHTCALGSGRPSSGLLTCDGAAPCEAPAASVRYTSSKREVRPNSLCISDGSWVPTADH